MSYCISNPSTVLSKFVKQYWSIEDCLTSSKEHVQRIVPNGLIELMFYLGDLPKSIDENKNFSENSLVTGQLNEYYDIKVTGNLSMFSITFQPYGLSVFFDIPVNEFCNQNVPLKYILKEAVSELEVKLYNSKSFTERVVIVEKFLLQRLKEAKKKYHFERINNSIENITQAKGLIDIETLASKAV
jgi:hypothetical protein